MSERAGDFAPRHVLYITAAFHMVDVQARVAAPTVRSRARHPATYLHREREARKIDRRDGEGGRESTLQNSKLRRHGDVTSVTSRETNSIKFRWNIPRAEPSLSSGNFIAYLGEIPIHTSFNFKCFFARILICQIESTVMCYEQQLSSGSRETLSFVYDNRVT